MPTQSYELLICPVCLKQVEWDAEYGSTCYHDEYGEVEAVRVEAEPKGLTPARHLALFRLQEQKREVSFREAERRWFANLPQEERERIDAERLAKMTSFDRMMDQALKSMIEDSKRSLLTQLGP